MDISPYNLDIECYRSLIERFYCLNLLGNNQLIYLNYQINSTHVVTKKGILLWVVIPWSIHFWAAITEQAPTIILPRTVTGNTRKKLIYVKNGYLATLLYGSGNPEHRSVFKIFPFNSSSSKMLVKTQNSCSQIN